MYHKGVTLKLDPNAVLNAVKIMRPTDLIIRLLRCTNILLRIFLYLLSAGKPFAG
jgi:hypothetical protein